MLYHDKAFSQILAPLLSGQLYQDLGNGRGLLKNRLDPSVILFSRDFGYDLPMQRE